MSTGRVAYGIFVTVTAVCLSTLTGCANGTPGQGAPLVAGTGAPVIVPGRPGDAGRTARPGENLGRSESLTSAADVIFAESMIPHHRQALEMTGLVAARASSDAVKAAAGRITAGQGPEIAAMSAWLRSVGRQAPAYGHGDHRGGGIYGMATLDQMNRLRAARGAAFDGLFLQLMITHHEGAVRMADEELRSGTDRSMRRMAQDIAAGQRTEIARMRALLADG